MTPRVLLLRERLRRELEAVKHTMSLLREEGYTSVVKNGGIYLKEKNRDT